MSPFLTFILALPMPALVRRQLDGISNGNARYLGDAGSAFLIRLVGAGAGFGLQVLLARLLSLTDYGLYVTYWTWLFVAGQIATLGFNDSCVRFLPRYVARQRLNDAHAFLGAGTRLVVTGSLTIAALGLALVFLGTQLPSGLMDGRWGLIAILFVGIPVLALELYVEGIARSLGWFILASAPAFILRPLGVAAVLIAAFVAGLELDAIAALGAAITVTAAMTLGQALLLRRLLRRLIGWPASGAGVGRKKRKLWLRATLPLIIVYGVEDIYLVSDVLLLGLLAEPADVGIYFAAVRVMTLAGYVYYAFMLISSREFALARASCTHAELQRRVSRATACTFWLTVPTVLAMVALGYPLLGVFGSEYKAGYGVLVVLGAGLIVRASVGQAGDLLVVLGHQRANLAAATMSLVFNIALTLALVPMLGILGAAIGTACSQAARAAALAYLVRRRAGLDPFILAGLPSRSEAVRPAERGFDVGRPPATG